MTIVLKLFGMGDIVIDADRLRRSFDAYSTIGATENGGLNRLTLTDTDKRVRDKFASDLEELGLDVMVDEMGNIFGRREGRNPDAPPVLIGSHLDSQPYGGRYDGQLGVLVALETMRAMEDAEIETERPIEIVNWTNEEGVRFENPLLGSDVFVGETSLREAYELTDDDENKFEDELKRIGYKGDTPCEPRPIHAFLELHIEQGPYLEMHDRAVGIVKGVFGMAWLEATIHGKSDHAGPTPMHDRRDALAVAAKAITEIESLPNRLAEDAVATVGRLSVEPDSINVIPNRVKFSIDVRSYDDDVVEKAIERSVSEVEMASNRAGADCDVDELWRIPPVEFSQTVRDAITQSVREVGASHEPIVSGAGHDAKNLNEITDTGMIFVPSAEGTTHNESEFTPWEDCVIGARTFAETTLRLAV